MNRLGQRIGPPATWYSAVVVDGCAFIFVPTTGRLLALNEPATRVWELCDGTRTRNEIVGLLIEAQDDPPACVGDDVDATVRLLREEGLLTPAAPPAP